MADAERFREEDEKRKQEVEIRNQGDSLLYQVDHSLKDLEGKIQPDEMSAIEAAKKELSDALAGSDTDLIDAKTKALSEALYKVTERIYGEAAAQQQAQQQGAPGADGGAQGGDYYEAEYEPVDDDKN